MINELQDALTQSSLSTVYRNAAVHSSRGPLGQAVLQFSCALLKNLLPVEST